MGSRRLWVKLWATWYTTASHLGVGGMALHCGATLMTCVVWHPGRDDAWAEFDDGSPLPIEAIAQRCQEPPKVVAAALAKLQTRGTISRRTDGAWGFELFGPAQESADASRKRTARSPDSPRTVHGQSGICPPEVLRIVEGEGEGEAEVAPTVLTTPTPPREGTAPDMDAAAKSERKKGGRSKPRETPPAGLAEHVLAELQRAARALPGTRTGPDRITPGMLDSIAKLHASEQPTADEWTRVITRRAALDREGDTFGALTWEHLCRPASFRRYRDGVAPPARPQNHQRGPAPVSSRPTESRTATVRELMREDEAREAAARERQP